MIFSLKSHKFNCINAKFKVVLILLIAAITAQAQLKVIDLKTEYRTNPVGIDIVKPRFSWKIESDAKNVVQTAYEIRLASDQAKLEKSKPEWQSGEVKTDQSLNVVYNGPDLKTAQRVYWQVRTKDNLNRSSSWSDIAFFEMGVLEKTFWNADFITFAQEPVSNISLPAHYYRKPFAIKKKIKQARLYATSLGVYEFFLNGERVGDRLFAPGFTSYNKRLEYQSYDVTSLLQKSNVIAATVADGWYRGYMGWQNARAFYGDKLALMAQLRIEYTDGSTEMIGTDETWKVTNNGPIRESDIYNGERYDATLEMKGWSGPGFDDSGWFRAATITFDNNILEASNSVPVRKNIELKALRKFKTPAGETVFDFGQNLVGWVKVKLQGNKGDSAVFQFAEVLDKEGNFYTKNLRTAKATNTYIFKGTQEETYEPHFTFHGFRYMKISHYDELKPEEVTAHVIYSDISQTGSFSCSDSLINRLQQNIQWSQRDNFLDIPTDCPQRDERLGWTGDAQVFGMTAAFNFDVAAFYTKWLKDLAKDQLPNGRVPHVIPDVLAKRASAATAWADAAVIMPYTVYLNYDDSRILEQQYPSMKAWVEYMVQRAGEDYLWNNNDFHFGDWLAFHSDSPAYAGAYTEKDLIASAYFYYSTSILAKTAKIIGEETQAEKYVTLAENIKKAFAKEYITETGRVVSGTQTAYCLVLSFDLAPTHLKNKIAALLAADVDKFGHLTTGFVGTPLLCKTLTDFGYEKQAFKLLNRKEFPGWLYPVTQGATTIWERWDTQKPDGTIIEGMNSFNHYAYGAIGEWLYSYIAGIKLDSQNPAYKHFFLTPHVGGELTHAKAELDSYYGIITSDWKLQDGSMNYTVEIPANTTATILLPKAKLTDMTNEAITSANQTNEGLSFKLGSGNYTFTYKYAEN